MFVIIGISLKYQLSDIGTLLKRYNSIISMCAHTYVHIYMYSIIGSKCMGNELQPALLNMAVDIRSDLIQHCISSLLMQGDDRYLITNSKDQTIKLWDLRKFSGCTGIEHTRASVTHQYWDYRWQEAPRTCTLTINKT